MAVGGIDQTTLCILAAEVAADYAVEYRAALEEAAAVKRLAEEGRRTIREAERRARAVREQLEGLPARAVEALKAKVAEAAPSNVRH